jgi:hypothetical protein
MRVSDRVHLCLNQYSLRGPVMRMRDIVVECCKIHGPKLIEINVKLAVRYTVWIKTNRN